MTPEPLWSSKGTEASKAGIKLTIVLDSTAAFNVRLFADYAAKVQKKGEQSHLGFVVIGRTMYCFPSLTPHGDTINKLRASAMNAVKVLEEQGVKGVSPRIPRVECAGLIHVESVKVDPRVTIEEDYGCVGIDEEVAIRSNEFAKNDLSKAFGDTVTITTAIEEKQKRAVKTS